MSQHQRQRCHPGCDRKPRNCDPGKLDLFCARFRAPSGVLSRQIDDQADDGNRLEFDPPDPEAMNLDHPCQRRRRPDQQLA